MSELESTPSRETIQEEIMVAVAEVTGYERAEVDTGSLLVDLELDSLLIVELVVAVRRRFGVELPATEFRTEIETVGELCDTLGDFIAANLRHEAA